MSINTDVGRRIKYFRKKRGLTLVKLAERLHISKSALSKYENGQVSITLDQVWQIADQLDINPLYLISDTFTTSEIIEKTHNDILNSNNYKKYYVYTMTGHNKAYFSKNVFLVDDDSCAFFAEVEDEDDYRKCKNYYTGSVKKTAGHLRCTLSNVLNEDDLLIIEKNQPLAYTNAEYAFAVSLSVGINFPIALRMLVYEEKCSNIEEAKRLLSYGNEDFKEIKKLGAFSIPLKTAKE